MRPTFFAKSLLARPLLFSCEPASKSLEYFVFVSLLSSAEPVNICDISLRNYR